MSMQLHKNENTIFSHPNITKLEKYPLFKERADAAKLHKNLDDLMLQMQQLNTHAPSTPGFSA